MAYLATSIADRTLMKMAAEEEKSSLKTAPSAAALQGYAKGGLAALPLGLGAAASSLALLKPAQRNMAYTSDTIDKLRKHVPDAANLPQTEIPHQMGSAYVPKPAGYMKKMLKHAPEDVKKVLGSRKLLLSRDAHPFITAHELGHASGGKARQALMRYKLPTALASGIGGVGLLAHAAMTGEKGEGMSASGYAAPAVAAVAPALTQFEELAATLKAKKLLGKAGIKPKHLKKMMTAQQLNYLFGGMAKVAPVAMGAYGLHQYLKPDEKEPKVAAAKKDKDRRSATLGGALLLGPLGGAIGAGAMAPKGQGTASAGGALMGGAAGMGVGGASTAILMKLLGKKAPSPAAQKALSRIAKWGGGVGGAVAGGGLLADSYKWK